jgi:hypothetical protein
MGACQSAGPAAGAIDFPEIDRTVHQDGALRKNTPLADARIPFCPVKHYVSIYSFSSYDIRKEKKPKYRKSVQGPEETIKQKTLSGR